MNRAFFSLILLGGCSGGNSLQCDSGVEVGPDDTACPVECFNTISTQSPSVDQSGVYYRSNLSVKLVEADTNATITLTSSSGDVAGTIAHDATTIWFAPDAPLAPSTTYTATVDYCSGQKSASWDFTTSAVGTAVTDSSSLVGGVYSMNLKDSTVTKPAGIGVLLADNLDTELLLRVHSLSGADLQIIGGVSPQGTCEPSITFPGASFSEDPYFTVGPDTTVLAVDDIEVNIGDLFISGAFSADGTSIEGATLSGLVDTRPLVALIDETGPPETICDLAVGMGASCVPCADGVALCLDLELIDMTAVKSDESMQPQHTNATTSPLSGSVNVCDDSTCSGTSGC